MNSLVLGAGFPLVDKITNMIQDFFGDSYKIAMAVIGIVALFYAGLVLITLLKEIKGGNWANAAKEAVKLIAIAAIAYFGLSGAFGLGKTVKDENLGTHEKPTVNDFIDGN